MTQYQIEMLAIPVVPYGSNMGISVIPDCCDSSYQLFAYEIIDFRPSHSHLRGPGETRGQSGRAAVFIAFAGPDRVFHVAFSFATDFKNFITVAADSSGFSRRSA